MSAVGSRGLDQKGVADVGEAAGGKGGEDKGQGDERVAWWASQTSESK